MTMMESPTLSIPYHIVGIRELYVSRLFTRFFLGFNVASATLLHLGIGTEFSDQAYESLTKRELSI
jgi:hypothetical protein